MGDSTHLSWLLGCLAGCGTEAVIFDYLGGLGVLIVVTEDFPLGDVEWVGR